MVVAMEGGEITKKHAKFHKLDAEGILPSLLCPNTGFAALLSLRVFSR